jgi:hypothetical protein
MNRFHLLPDEVILRCFSNLTAGDLCRVGLVNTQFNKIAQDERLWKDLCIAYGLPIEYKLDNQTWRHFFIARVAVQVKITKVWQEIKSLLPRPTVSTLNLPTTEEQLESAQRKLNLRFPIDLAVSFLIHNGQMGGQIDHIHSGRGLIFDHRLLRVDEVVKETFALERFDFCTGDHIDPQVRKRERDEGREQSELVAVNFVKSNSGLSCSAVVAQSQGLGRHQRLIAVTEKRGFKQICVGAEDGRVYLMSGFCCVEEATSWAHFLASLLPPSKRSELVGL